jgi:hypothetical protein
MCYRVTVSLVFNVLQCYCQFGVKCVTVLGQFRV